MNVIPQPTPGPRQAGGGSAIGALNPPNAETILAVEVDATNVPDQANREATPSAGKTTLDWANYYHNLGLPVFPLESGGKRPAFVVIGGRSQRVRWKVFQNRLAMDEERREWFSVGKNNLAIVSCPLSKLVVLDFDAETGEMLLGLLQQLGLPRAPTVHSPGGGRHLYFRTPENDVLIYPREHWLPGLDPRGYGSYVAAPPSIGANGRPYAWDVDDHIEQLPPPQLPDWLIDILIAPTTTIARELFKQRLIKHFGEQHGADTFLDLLALETFEATGKTALRTHATPQMARNENQLSLSGQILDEQGLIVDGRKRYAAKVVWGRLARYIREEGKYPSVEELTELAWDIYFQKVDHTRKPSLTREGVQSLAKYALKRAQAGMLPPPEEAKEEETPAKATVSLKELSEESVARVFESRYRDELRYVEDSGRWIRWNGNFWKPAAQGSRIFVRPRPRKKHEPQRK